MERDFFKFMDQKIGSAKIGILFGFHYPDIDHIPELMFQVRSCRHFAYSPGSRKTGSGQGDQFKVACRGSPFPKNYITKKRPTGRF